MNSDQIFVGVGAIVENKGKFLVVEEANGKYSFPGGHVMDREKLEDATSREVYEETNVKAEAEYIIGFYLIPGALGVGIKCKYIESEDFKPKQEIKNIFWMSKEDIIKNKENFRPGQLLGFMDYIKGVKIDLNLISNYIS